MYHEKGKDFSKGFGNKEPEEDARRKRGLAQAKDDYHRL
jgi:hypothetical protein